MKRAGILCAVPVIVAAAAALPSPAAFAAGASLGFSPSSGSYAAGSTFTVSVVVDSGGGVGVNAADGKITFDPSLLNVKSVSKEGSVFNLWVADPSFSNAEGSVSFSGGGNAAYTGSSGKIISITFKALKAGTAEVKFFSSSALAADGQGTNVLQSSGSASYVIGGATAPSASAPSPSSDSSSGSATGGSSSGGPIASPFVVSIAVASPTHPQEGQWYANNNPNFTWQLTSDVAGVSTAFNQGATSYSRRVSEGLLSSKQLTNIGEGVWYFHVRFEDALGNWSDPVNRMVQIDMTPPLAFAVKAQVGGGISGRTLLAFNTTDTLSGLDHYEAIFDGMSSTSVGLGDVQNGIYTAPPLLPGKHAVVIRALDKASNFAEAHAEFDIPGIAVPKITNFPSAITERSTIVVEGVADSGANVTLDVRGEGGKIDAEGKMIADQAGHWVFALPDGLTTGKYDLGVSMITTQGAAASSSDKLTMQVNSAPFIEKFGLVVIVFLFAVIGGLIGYGLYRKKLIDIKWLLTRRENEETRLKTKAVFEALREEVEEKVNLMEGGVAQAQGAEKLEPEHVLEALRNALAVSESTIQKEIDDVDKSLDAKS